MTSGFRAAQADVAQQISALQLVARRLAAGVIAGLHRSVHRGGSAEFAEYKEYASGDDPRTIDWKSVARTDRYFVKRFEETTNRRSFLVLDASASMAFARGGRASKMETARIFLGALGALLLRQGDAVGLTVLRGAGVASWVRPRARGAHLEALLATLVAAEPSGGTDIAAGLDAVAAGMPRRSLVVLVSDLVDEPASGGAALRRLFARGHEVVVFQVLDQDEVAFPFIGSLRFRDPETGVELTTEAAAAAEGYRSELATFLERWDREAASGAADLVRFTNADDSAQVLLRFLARRKALARRILASA